MTNLQNLLAACGWRETRLPPLDDPKAEELRAALALGTRVDDSDARAIAEWAVAFGVEVERLFSAASPALAGHARQAMNAGRYDDAMVNVDYQAAVTNAVLSCYIAGVGPVPTDIYAQIGDTPVTYAEWQEMERGLGGVRIVVVQGGRWSGKTVVAEIMAAQRNPAVDRIELELDWRGGALDGAFDMATELEKLRKFDSSTERAPVDYLQHDPTKRHTWGQAKRRMRRSRRR